MSCVSRSSTKTKTAIDGGAAIPASRHGRIENSSCQIDVADVNGHHEILGNDPAVGVAAVRPPPGRQLDPVGFHDVVNVLNCRESAGDVNPVVVTAQQEVAAEIEFLRLAVSRKLIRKLRL